jgi:hypothetical protein
MVSVLASRGNQPRSIAVIEAALRCSWSVDTSADPERWMAASPAWGQCAVSALIVQDHLGGALLRCPAPGGSHYFNVLPDGSWLDTTGEQFGSGFTPTNVEGRDRAYVLSFLATRHRYALLRRSVDIALRH